MEEFYIFICYKSNGLVWYKYFVEINLIPSSAISAATVEVELSTGLFNGHV
jgi:hypothetical protein